MKPSNIGGQAVVEGIMMRHKDKYSVAVRKPDKEIEIKVEDYKSVGGKSKLLKKPILRGVVSFIDSLIIGSRCLFFSSKIAGEETEEDLSDKDRQVLKDLEEAKKRLNIALLDKGDNYKDIDKIKDEIESLEQKIKTKKEKNEKILSLIMTATMIVTTVLSIGLFVFLPYVLASLLKKIGANEAIITIIESIVRIVLFTLYMYLISRTKDIQRTFMYHGAEHKCINCIESGKELTVKNVMESSRFHRRCGTSFLFVVMIVAILLHMVFVFVPIYWVRLVGRLLMIPIVAGVSFELIAWAGRTDTALARLFSTPGFKMQLFTTKEPDESMVEVAIKAVEAVFDWRKYLDEEFNNNEK